MTPFRYKVSLRFTGHVLEPAAISERLGLAPQFARKMGAARTTPKGDPLEGTYASNYCSFKLDPRTDEPLDAMLLRVVSGLDANRDLFLQVSETGGTSEFFVGWFAPRNSGVTFNHQLLSKLADLRINLGLNVYGGD